jgi:hypothetical protein
MTFFANVTDVRLVSRANGVARWQILLDRSESFDPLISGTLIARSASGVILIVKVASAVCDEAGQRWLVTEKPLPVGTDVEVNLAVCC